MTLLIFGLIIISFLILLLVLPLNIEFSVKIYRQTNCKVRFRHFFKLLSWEFNTQQDNRHKLKLQQEKNDAYALSQRVYKAAHVSGIWKSIWLLLKRVRGKIKVRKINSDFQVGLGEDYYTGMLIGILIPLIMFINTRIEGAVNLMPVFEEEPVLEGYLIGDIQVRPVSVIGASLAFLLSPPVWKARQILQST